jgi:preflagellin peptidase FlaK
MAPYLLFFLFSVFGLGYGTYTDFKERIVSNWVTYGMVAAGLGGHALWALFSNDAMVFANSLAVTIATFIGAYVLYRLGVWAGGDVKLFAGLAALNPLNPNLLTSLGLVDIELFGSVALPIFPLTLFIFSLFAMLPYGAFLAAAKLAKNKAEKKKLWPDLRKRFIHALELSALTVGLSAILSMLGLNQLLVLPLLFLAAFLPKKAKAVAAGAMLIAGLWLQANLAAQSFFVLLALLLGLYLLFKLYMLSKTLMRKPVAIKELEEGMIPAQTLVLRGKKVEILPELEIKKLIKQFVANNGKAVKQEGKGIVSSRSAGGLTENEIKELKALLSKKKIGPTLLVKESAPFVPAVLIAYIALNIVGDVIWVWLF